MAGIVPVTVGEVGDKASGKGRGRRRKPAWDGAEAIPTKEYVALLGAYFYFNKSLFGGKLPECLITLQRKKGSRGYFSSRRFEGRTECAATDEIALNPATFKGCSDLEILSVLVHEMVHLWQHHFGKPTRASYHNREWAAQMEAIGLMPSHTGLPGGNRTGQRMSHYIIPGGAYETTANALLASGFKLHWQSLEAAASPAPRKLKVKYVCGCPRAMWGQPGIDGWRCDVCESPVREVK